jgi:hypothetical protein
MKSIEPVRPGIGGSGANQVKGRADRSAGAGSPVEIGVGADVSVGCGAVGTVGAVVVLEVAVAVAGG